MIHVMLDFETWSPKPHALITEIGAVRFDESKILERFHVGIDPESWNGQRHIDAGTVLWWMDEKRAEAREKWFAMPKVDAFAALDGFAQWLSLIPEKDRGSLWGKGATFDNVILRNACEQLNIDVPFGFRQDECYRTIANRCSDVEFKPAGTSHVSVDDAEAQAVHLQQIAAQYAIKL